MQEAMTNLLNRLMWLGLSPGTTTLSGRFYDDEENWIGTYYSTSTGKLNWFLLSLCLLFRSESSVPCAKL